ncbi:MAG: response regulator transcription factor [Clostridium sp.]|uniref:response regulator transcription factor n=1 Tax=Clostridium TaxID=1485 RepID=UPI0021522CBE|nr:response regulator transcription factor [Clostridium sp. LY3-2]MCR6514786.1 response regulator transcription factor [Clostridium sp. LY3-2]
MYKVMLVDDEKLITEGLKNLIDWEKLNLEVVATANNGEEALRKLKEEKVHIVITDINMPVMTGLDLIKEVKGKDNKTNFIILSGYDEFSYAKKAIEYGVDSYILKPIDEEELEKTLIKLLARIEKSKKEKKDVLYKNTKLLQFINGKINKEEILKIEDELNIPLRGKSYTVSSIILNKKNEDGKYINIDEIIEEYSGKNYELLHKFDGQTILINSWDLDVKNEDILKYFNFIKDKLIEKIEGDVFIAVGDVTKDIDLLKNSLNSSNKLKKYILTEGTNICLTSEDVTNIKDYKTNFSKEIERLNKIIIEKDGSGAKMFLEGLIDDIALTPKNIYDLSIRVVMLIDKISDEFKVDKKYVKDSLSSNIVELCSESTRDSIKAFLVSEIEELISVMYSTTKRYSPVVSQIVSNIEERYSEELSLKTLAYQYNINSSYLGRIFTKEVGMSFSDYLNKVKNTKAKELILETNMKINDIAKAIGYTDTSYFYRKFKKYYGICPSTLREMKNY